MPPYEIKYAGDSDRTQWDGYVRKHANASLFHMFRWGDVIRRTYGHATYYLMLMSRSAKLDAASERIGEEGRCSAESIVGVLPLIHLKHAFFGNCLVSLPFFDAGGILADCREGFPFLNGMDLLFGRDCRLR